jgi:hypothetical protein
MKFQRVWAMPNSNTFDIKCINNFIQKYNQKDILSIDPFANKNRIAKITNDIDPSFNCDFNMDAIDFLKSFASESVDLVLFDPPYSPRQVSECYKKMNMTVNMETTQSSFWSKMKIEVARIVKPEGYCISFGWNSNGIGINRGFELQEILLVAHGGHHNDTICIAEKKKNLQPLF